MTNEKDREEASEKAWEFARKVHKAFSIYTPRLPVAIVIEHDESIRAEAMKAERELILEAHSLLSILPECRETTWEADRLELVTRLEAAILSDDQEPSVCEWTYDSSTCSWDTSCGEKWQFTADGPKENGVRYCHACGKPVKEEGRG